jgi:hypothetical protein
MIIADMLNLSNHRTYMQEYFELFYAIPGFANWFLSEDIMLPEEPIEDGHEFIHQKQMGKSHRHLVSLPWAYFVQGFYAQASFVMYSQYEGESLYHKMSPLATSILKRQMKNWTTPYIREGLPWKNAVFNHRFAFDTAAAGLLDEPAENTTLMRQRTAPDEVIPGAKVFDLIATLIQEDRAYYMLNLDQNIESLETLLHNHGALMSQSGPFSHLTPIDRIRLYEMYQHWERNTQVNSEIKEAIFPSLEVLIFSASSKIFFQTCDYATRHRITERISQHTLDMLNGTRKYLISLIAPSVKAYLTYSSRHHGAEKLPKLPDDCVELISLFACPDQLVKDQK